MRVRVFNMSDLKNKRIITVALTGAYPGKSENPNVPVSPEEIAEDAYKCWKAGAAIAHIHVRDDEGKASMSHEKFRRAVQLLRAKKDCDIVINLTTSGSTKPLTNEDRTGHIVELLPEMASFDAGSMNWQNTTVFMNSPEFLEYLGNKLNEINVKPEIEIFDAGMIYNAQYYLKKGILKAPMHFQFVLGVAGGSKATVQNLVYLHSLLPEGCTWSALGIGREHLPILYTTLALGGHIRVGMEDNVMYSATELATGNTQFVERAKRIIEDFGCEAATPEEARQILGLTRKV
jgi:3-keto-5-aminohexanoate cleavage enzyme